MIPTGLKLYIGIAMTAVTAAIIGGYTSGGDVVGPLSAGYKGGVGDQVSYTVLVGVAFVALIVGSLLAIFRDADAEAVAEAMGTSVAPVGQRPVATSIWPIVAGLGVAFVAVGMAVNATVTGIGIVIMAIVAFEWTMTAWADRATGDSATNVALRNQVMGPFEVPLWGLLGGGMFVLAASRVFLRFPGTGAVVFGAVIAISVLSVAVLLTQRPNISKNVGTALVAVLAILVLAGGVFSAATTEHHETEEHSDEESGEEEHGEEVGAMSEEATS
ncbi:MAG: hypothetical protein ACI81L_003283 [Verrucomicrobiales bacterium]|jgi:hypothetical protein